MLSTMEKYAMALAEAGYPDVSMTQAPNGKISTPYGSIPPDVQHRAFLVVNNADTCFECWDRLRWKSVPVPVECIHGRDA
jgi:hypothetical protein